MTAPLIATVDSPRAHRNNPLASHVAADRSQRTLHKVRDAVLEIIAADGDMTGAEMNDAYRTWRVSNRHFPACHFDSPRKRLGELAEDALVDVVFHRHGSVEAVYRVSPEGRRMLGVES